MRQEVSIVGERARICTTTGVVREEKKWSETQVRGWGVTVNHGLAHAYVEPVSSSSKTRHEFWICSNDGTETCIDLGNSRVRVRDGQVVSAAWGASSRSEGGPFLLLHNQTGQESQWLMSYVVSMMERMKLSDPCSKVIRFFCVAVALLGIWFFTNHLALMGLILLVAGFGYLIFAKRQQKQKGEAIKDAVLRVLAEEIQATSGLYRRSMPSNQQERSEQALPSAQ